MKVVVIRDRNNRVVTSVMLDDPDGVRKIAKALDLIPGNFGGASAEDLPEGSSQGASA